MYIYIYIHTYMYIHICIYSRSHTHTLVKNTHNISTHTLYRRTAPAYVCLRVFVHLLILIYFFLKRNITHKHLTCSLYFVVCHNL